ncbi:MAG: hypothetical protein Q9160_000132 [Pyrenula sp. 1 TL-2023]
MSSQRFTLRVQPRGKPIPRLPEDLPIASGSAAEEIYNQLAQSSRLSAHRLRITKGSDGSVLPNVADKTIQATGLRDQSTIYVKDLGPQIAWRTVFVIEYLGPLLIHPLIYFLRPYIYPSAPSTPSYSQTLFCALVILHFLKREAETLFVHRFSLATMPARNIFKNSFHYWVLAGANLAAWCYAPSSPTAKDPPSVALLYSGLLLYSLGELGNFSAHLTLRNLRSSGGKERGIPSGWGFDLVTCPNYMFEIIAWIGVTLVGGLSLSVLLFDVISVGQMALWARKKENKYRKEFGDKYRRKRYVLLPGIY